MSEIKGINSKNKRFKVSVQSYDEPINYIISPEKKAYLIAERNTPFVIAVFVNKDVNDVYGARLFIDGKLVQWQKTLKRRGKFFGVKMGDCNYKEFVFDLPPIETFLNSSTQNEDFGTIRIEFFSTQPVVSKKVLKKLSRKGKLSPTPREDDKKFYMRSMTISEGQCFRIKNTYIDYLDSMDGDTVIENTINFSDMIDEITIYYADFVALQIKGIISLKNRTHLHYIPKRELNKNYAIAALQTLIQWASDKKISLELIEKDFLKHVGHDLKLYLQKDETAENFIRKNFKQFQVSVDGYVTMTNSEIYYQKMIPWDFNQSDYITTPKTTRYSTSLSKICIDLTDENEIRQEDENLINNKSVLLNLTEENRGIVNNFGNHIFDTMIQDNIPENNNRDEDNLSITKNIDNLKLGLNNNTYNGGNVSHPSNSEICNNFNNFTNLNNLNNINCPSRQIFKNSNKFFADDSMISNIGANVDNNISVNRELSEEDELDFNA